MTAPLAYSLREVAPPQGAGILGLTLATGSSSYARPTTFALGAGGSVAAIVGPLPASFAGTSFEGTSVLIVRNDGSRTVLTFPRHATYDSCAAPGATSSNSQPTARLDAVAVARDGTPFVSISCVSSGAYLHIFRSAALWNGDGWHDTTADLVPLHPTNRSVGAADTPINAAYNGDYGYTFANLDEAQSTAHYQEQETGYTRAGRGFSLGYGVATAMRGQFVAGYSDGVNWTTPGLLPTIALEWTDGLRSELGPGVAYAVNGSGTVAGDDETKYGASDGHPVMWTAGNTVRLSASHGAAYAIADDGTLVGAVDRGGFVIAGGDATRRLRYLDDMVPHAWHISGAYGIAANGRILAVGNHHSGADELLLLDPITR